MAAVGVLAEIRDHPCYKWAILKPVTNASESCDGCDQRLGTGTSYKVEDGTVHDKYLHICCALLKPKLNDLKISRTSPEGVRRICGKYTCRFKALNGNDDAVSVSNFGYYRRSNNTYYHPCCAIESCECTPATVQNSKVRSITKMHG